MDLRLEVRRLSNLSSFTRLATPLDPDGAFMIHDQTSSPSERFPQRAVCKGGILEHRVLRQRARTL
jgi:hypothetical protein